MWAINNDSDLRMTYGVLRGMESREDKNDALTSLIVDIKRSIREYTNAPVGEHRVIKDHGIDGVDVIFSLPISSNTTKDEAREYFEFHEYIDIPRSAWDCTGRAFTQDFKVFKRRGSWYAYHAIRYDV